MRGSLGHAVGTSTRPGVRVLLAPLQFRIKISNTEPVAALVLRGRMAEARPAWRPPPHVCWRAADQGHPRYVTVLASIRDRRSDRKRTIRHARGVAVGHDPRLHGSLGSGSTGKVFRYVSRSPRQAARNVHVSVFRSQDSFPRRVYSRGNGPSARRSRGAGISAGIGDGSVVCRLCPNRSHSRSRASGHVSRKRGGGTTQVGNAGQRGCARPHGFIAWNSTTWHW
jgi:hypothetical protein